MVGRALPQADEPKQVPLDVSEDIQRPRQLASLEHGPTEQQPIDKAVAQGPHPIRRASIRRRTDDRAQAARQLSRAVKHDRRVERGEPIVLAPPDVDAGDVRRPVKVELAPDQIREDRRADAELVDKVELDRRHPTDPRFLVDRVEGVVRKVQDELDIRERVAFANHPRAVHQRRDQSIVRLAERPHPLDQFFLREGLVSSVHQPRRTYDRNDPISRNPTEA